MRSTRSISGSIDWKLIESIHIQPHIANRAGSSRLLHGPNLNPHRGCLDIGSPSRGIWSLSRGGMQWCRHSRGQPISTERGLCNLNRFSGSMRAVMQGQSPRSQAEAVTRNRRPVLSLSRPRSQGLVAGRPQQELLGR